MKSLKKKIRKAKQQITKIFELPAEAITGVFRIIAIGNNSLYMENHKGILVYTQKKLKINTEENEVLIMGDNLLLKKMGKKNLMVEGNIKILEFSEK